MEKIRFIDLVNPTKSKFNYEIRDVFYAHMIFLLELDYLLVLRVFKKKSSSNLYSSVLTKLYGYDESGSNDKIDRLIKELGLIELNKPVKLLAISDSRESTHPHLRSTIGESLNGFSG